MECTKPWNKTKVEAALPSPVAELLEDVVGAQTLWHLRKLHLGKVFELFIQFQTLFIFIVLSNSQICKKNINKYSF
jgi:hypothetical protein